MHDGEGDMWSIGLPEQLRRRFNDLTQSVTALSEACQKLELNLEKRASKTEVISALTEKIGRNDTIFTELSERIETAMKEVAHVGAVEENLGGVAKRLESLTEVHSETAGRLAALQDRVKADLGDTTKTLQQERLAAEAALKEELTTTTRQAQDELSERITGVDSNLTQRIKQSVEALETHLTALQKTREAVLRQEFESFQGRNDQATSAAKMLISGVQADMSSLAARMDSASKALGSLRERTDQQAEAAEEHIQRVEKSISDVESRVAKAIQQAVQGATASLQTAIIENVDRVRKECKSEVSREVMRVRDDMGRIEERLQESLVPIRQELVALRAADERITQSIAEVSSRLDASLEAQNKRITEDAAARERTFAEGIRAVRAEMESFSKLIADEQAKREEIQNMLLSVSSQEELLRALEDALHREGEERVKADNTILSIIAPLKEDLAKELEAKADWNDVRRSLWTKVDKADLPIAFSTKSILPSGGGGIPPAASAPPLGIGLLDSSHRCLSCDALMAPSPGRVVTGPRPSRLRNPSPPRGAAPGLGGTTGSLSPLRRPPYPHTPLSELTGALMTIQPSRAGSPPLIKFNVLTPGVPGPTPTFPSASPLRKVPVPPPGSPGRATTRPPSGGRARPSTAGTTRTGVSAGTATGAPSTVADPASTAGGEREATKGPNLGSGSVASPWPPR
ncbi:hypothetical protein PAPYR_1208 [Paratrimastix pyriformis]|uniref:Uncharacterized protein n=1 Tax=Paratrimastix pyriformis TaxID=342808 RepID=A0ABQ8USD5_9EUKA|nr:hypothetical protein PAPYR_1208 [Paratrimastix pyriformis]